MPAAARSEGDAGPAPQLVAGGQDQTVHRVLRQNPSCRAPAELEGSSQCDAGDTAGGRDRIGAGDRVSRS